MCWSDDRKWARRAPPRVIQHQHLVQDTDEGPTLTLQVHGERPQMHKPGVEGAQHLQKEFVRYVMSVS